MKKSQNSAEMPVSQKSMNTSQTGGPSTTFTTGSPDQELPPSMEKLQGVSYNMKTINGNLRSSHSPPNEHEDPAKSSATFLPSSEDVEQEFRLSRRPMHGSHDSSLNKAQMSSSRENGSSSSEVDKPRAPVMNYKSRISVPLTYTSKQSSDDNLTSIRGGNGIRNLGSGEKVCYNNNEQDNSESSLTKPSSLDFSDMDIPGDIISPDEPHHTPANVNQPSSPIRKRWETDPSSIGEPQLAVSKSNHNILDANNMNTSDEMQLSPGNSEKQVDADRLDNSIAKDDEELHKKGLSLFIGDNTAGESVCIYLNYIVI